MTKKIGWTDDLLRTLYDMKCNGKSLKDCVSFLLVKTGIEVTPACVSIRLKAYRQQMGLNFKGVDAS